MNTKRILFVVLAALFAIPSLGAAPAHAAPGGCTVITYLPYTITQPGCYCLAQNFSQAITGASAIAVNASNVDLDFDGYTIENTAGSGNFATCVLASNRVNVRVHGGTARGFYRGVHLSGNSPQYSYLSGLVVEDMTFLANGLVGISIVGSLGSVVAHNSVVGTSYSGTSTTVYTYGIFVQGPGAWIHDNNVFYTGNKPGLDAVGIGLGYGPGSVVERNAIGNPSLPTGNPTFGISLTNASTSCVVANNRITFVSKAVFFGSGTSGTYHDNVASGCEYPYDNGGTNSGNNY
jgi:hypothetical protein